MESLNKPRPMQRRPGISHNKSRKKGGKIKTN